MMTSSFFKKIVKLEVLALSLFLLVFHLVCIASVSMGTEVEIDCDQLLLKEGLKNVDKDRIMEIQSILEQRGYYTIGIDGIAGPLTRAALEKYCADSKMEPSPEKEKRRSKQQEGVGVVYTLTEEDLEEQKTYNDILLKLQDLNGKEFKGKYELIQAVEDTIKKVTDDPYSEYQSLFINEVEVQHRDSLITYTLTERSFQVLKEKIIPGVIIEKLKILQDVTYPNKKLFRQALTAPILELTEQYKLLIVKHARNATIYQLKAEAFNKLRVIIPENIIEELKTLQDMEYTDEKCFRQALKNKIFTQEFTLKILGLTDRYDSLIMEKAKKKYTFSDYKDKKIKWTGEPCGCVLEDLTGVIYGFYPFWLAGEEQTLDFSVLSRIGYYALSLDKRGNIVDPISWDRDRAAFINKARDHRTKVDLVVHVDRWNEWRQLDSNAFHEVMDNIVRLITRKLPNRLLNRIKPFITFGGKSVPPIGDGITLYFEGPEEGDGDAKNSFVSFIKVLRKKLKATGEDYRLNIMLPMDAIGEGLFGFESLSLLIPDEKEEEEGYERRNYVDYFLVFLEEPTTDTKKELRMRIEDNFKGIQRKTMLRKIIPVITPAIPTTDVEEHIQKVEQQLKDDFIYFVDNFGGVGIWPLPFTYGQDGVDTEADDVTAMRAQVINRNLKEGKAPVTGICKFVCPKRWYIRIAWDLSLAVLAVLCLCYFICCKVRFLSCCYRADAKIILGAHLLLTVLLHVLLLRCDPHRSFAFTDRVTIIGFSVYAAALVILVQLYRRKGEQP